jgi:hypothetical protein
MKHLARMKKKLNTKFCSKDQKGKNNFRTFGVDGKTALGWILGVEQMCGMD